MTEPPRPPGDDTPGASPDPAAPPPPPPYSVPGEAPAYGYGQQQPPSDPSYSPPPSGGYSPPPSGGYTPPPAGGGYAPPPSYPPAGGYQAGPGPVAAGDEKTWILISHFGGAAGMFVSGGILGFVPPLIAYLAKGKESQAVRAHSVAALNFQLLWSIIGFIGWLTACIFIGFIVLIAAIIVGVVFGIIAGLRANEGQLYKYPMTVSIIK